MKRNFAAAQQNERCRHTVTLRDGSTAQCMRKATIDGFCWQHGCDCQAPDAKGVKLVSMGCPVHNG